MSVVKFINHLRNHFIIWTSLLQLAWDLSNSTYIQTQKQQQYFVLHNCTFSNHFQMFYMQTFILCAYKINIKTNRIYGGEAHYIAFHSNGSGSLCLWLFNPLYINLSAMSCDPATSHFCCVHKIQHLHFCIIQTEAAKKEEEETFNQFFPHLNLFTRNVYRLFLYIYLSLHLCLCL